MVLKNCIFASIGADFSPLSKNKNNLALAKTYKFNNVTK